MRRLILGQVPAEETPAAPTSLQALTNIRRFRELVKETVGEVEPAARGRLGIVLVPGRGYVLAFTFDPNNEPAADYAETLHWQAPLTWPHHADTRPIPAGPAARNLQTVELGRTS